MTKTDKTTQCERLLRALKAAGTQGVTAMQALDQGGMYRAGARVFELRKRGYKITTERRPGMTARYRLEPTITSERRP